MISDNPNTTFDGVVAPALVRELAEGRPVEPVWVNQIGGVTWSIGDGAEFVKYGPPHWEFDPEPEFARLRWVSRFVTAPQPIDHGMDGENVWLRTLGIPATSAVLDGRRDHPAEVVPELGRALRRFHDTVPAEGCEWEYSIAGRLSRKAETEWPDRSEWPDIDPVVCHGDACNPNFLLDSSGTCVGYVDLGKLGVGDRWGDLAPALLSLGWNFGEGWQEVFLEAYGIERDAAKQDFYTRLWNAT